MLTSLIIYLSFGIILLFIGPLAKELDGEKIVLKHHNAKKNKIAVRAYLVCFIIACILFYPTFFYSYFFQKNLNDPEIIRKSISSKITDGNLYFRNTTGIGDILCKECDYFEYIINFTHGYDSVAGKRCDKTGYQCETCGKFKAVFGFEKKKKVIPQCDCGGKLQREKPLFCPRCKSNQMQFRIKFIT